MRNKGFVAVGILWCSKRPRSQRGRTQLATEERTRFATADESVYSWYRAHVSRVLTQRCNVIETRCLDYLGTLVIRFAWQADCRHKVDELPNND